MQLTVELAVQPVSVLTLDSIGTKQHAFYDVRAPSRKLANLNPTALAELGRPDHAGTSRDWLFCGM